MNLPEPVEILLDHCKNYASDLLMESGELFPFGALTDARGRTHHREVEVDLKNIPSNGEIIEALETYFKDQMENHDALGYAVACEARVQLDEHNTTDSVAIDIRYKDDPDLPMFYLPFAYKADKDHVEFGSLFAVKRT